VALTSDQLIEPALHDDPVAGELPVSTKLTAGDAAIVGATVACLDSSVSEREVNRLIAFTKARALCIDHKTIAPNDLLIGADYLQRVRRLAPQAERITDKMPGNFVLAACLEFHRTQRSVRTASAAQVRRSSVGRWRPHAHALEPLLQALAGLREKPSTAVSQLTWAWPGFHETRSRRNFRIHKDFQ